LGLGVTAGEGSAVVSLSRGATLSRQFAILIAIFFATNLVSSAQSIPSSRTVGGSPSAPLRTPSPFTHLKPQTLEAPYRPLTPRESLRWFTANTIDPSNLIGGVFDAGFGTAPNRPKEYGPHWGGFAKRYGIGMTRSTTGNAIEAGAGLILREDPRYFRMPNRPFRARVRNVVRLAFAARAGNGSFGPAYARYMAVFGNNFLSNSWRVNSEANVHDALLRSAEGFGGVLASNACEEFWPDVKKWLFHKRN
jgi:hypothetical protein